MSRNKMAILTDVTRCTGCEKCVDACQEANDLPKERSWRWIKQIDDLSSARWTTITRLDSDKGARYLRKPCLHCAEPSCVSACIVGALKKTPEGPVVYNPDICIGCRYCMIACPWEIPRYSWEDSVPYIQKCDMCFERVIKDGKLPACVEACPTQATIFGDRDELLAEAKRRLSREPHKYINKIWGASEVGGTSVMYISDVDIKLTGLDAPVISPEPMPHRTTKILHQMPLVFTGMSLLMGGLYWMFKRRQEVMAAENMEAVNEIAVKPDEDAAEENSSKDKKGQVEE